jgi:hypothetical protein
MTRECPKQSKVPLLFGDEDDIYESVHEAIQELARKGKIYDTGKRRWSERTGSYQIVWATKIVH